jgi:hypothetical protein
VSTKSRRAARSELQRLAEKERRAKKEAEAAAKKEADLEAKKASEQSDQSTQSAKTQRTRKHRRKRILRKTATILGLVTTFAFGYYQVRPTWNLETPSTAMRPVNPFTTIFTISNSGVLPAANITAVCLEKMIEYDDSVQLPGYKGAFSGPLIGPKATSSWLESGAKMTVDCSQQIAYVGAVGRALSSEEIRAKSEEGLAKLQQGKMDDPPIKWMDVELDIEYAPIPILPWFRTTTRRRVVGQRSENNVFVWMPVPLDKEFDRPSYDSRRQRPVTR